MCSLRTLLCMHRSRKHHSNQVHLCMYSGVARMSKLAMWAQHWHMQCVYIYRVSSNLVCTPCGFNRLRGHNYKKTYYPEDLFCANIIRDIRISCVSSSDFEYVISSH